MHMLDSAILPIYQRRKAYFINTIKDRVIGVEEHVFGVWGGGGKSARGAHRNSKAQSAFFDGGTQT
jgi:hypothetical protein